MSPMRSQLYQAPIRTKRSLRTCTMPLIRQQPGPTEKFPPNLVGDDSDTLLGTLQKNADDMLVVQFRSYRHSHFLDVRHFYRNERNGKWLPSTKGIAFRPGLLKQLIQLLVAAEKRAVAGGLIDDRSTSGSS